MTTPPKQDPPRLADVSLAIATERLALRPYHVDDAEALWPTVSQPEFPRWMSWAAHGSIDETRAWIASTVREIENNEGVTWGMFAKDTGEHVGTISLDGITWKVAAWRKDVAEIGYWLHAHQWNRGYATEAGVAVVTWAFETLGLHKVTIGCIADNIASKRVIEKIGFRYSHRVDADVWKTDRWLDHLKYEITVGEWFDISSTLRFNRPVARANVPR